VPDFGRVFLIQNYEVYFGLYPSSGINDKNSQRFGDWICLRPQVDGVLRFAPHQKGYVIQGFCQLDF
jgi:hypothetical protein